jgi:UDP-2,4-diacetamido-2,4,6-trideoxy-beta-L-altropyranose hydrolase
MNLLIRADASAQIGTGHLMRCLALSQAWQETGGTACFVLACPATSLEARLRAEGMEVVYLDGVEAGSHEDAARTAVLAEQLQVQWIVVDGYHFGADYQHYLKTAGFCLLFIDDYAHASNYYADIVLNQNIYAQVEMYTQRETYTRLLLGTEYVLLRREFWKWRDRVRPVPAKARKILVTLGGSDPDNVTLTVIQALQLLPDDDWEAIVLAGGQNPNYQTLAAAVAAEPRIQLRQNVTNMPELMAWADIAVSASGSSVWEFGLLGVPTLITELAENQRLVAAGLANTSTMINLGWYSDLRTADVAQSLQSLLSDAAKRQQLSQLGRQLVNGNGAKAVVTHLQGEKLNLRKAQIDDCRLVWEWANDPVTRRHSFSSDAISWEEHTVWFTDKLNDPNIYFYLGFNVQDEPVGYVRFQRTNDVEANISVAVAPKQRRQGYGVELIRLGVETLWQVTQVSQINAFIKADNLTSRRVFTKGGFSEIDLTTTNGERTYRFIKQKRIADVADL